MENKEWNMELANYRKTLKSLAYRFTVDPDEIQDLVQETILRALKYMDQFVHNPKVISWLFVIMKNIYINQYRTLKQRFTYENHCLATYNNDGYQEAFVASSAEGNFILNDVKTVLDTIPKDHGEMFRSYLNGYKYKELSVQYGLPEGTVKSRIHMVRKHLQKKLDQYKYN